ncbi:hypothetical protein IGL24_000602 [Enterococcus sp. DIV2371]|uniref:DUF4352 domain-containing protein n=1 Tax=Candidatus Enterococcus mangumiae TaxID=2230878 RepID=A0ABZ2SYN0_9ENTE|nr:MULTISPECIES: hypothetical protein [unclassified Enterococcus]MBO0462718.1 hypothetical protein [Enterococcus sp. DIV1298c]MBO0489685.1 hypothetical protein [Enterococcus sp. DIV1094]
MKNKVILGIVSLFFLLTLTSCKSASNTDKNVTVITSTVTTDNKSSESSSAKSEPENESSNDTSTLHGLNDPVTIYLAGKPAVTIEILNASAQPDEVIRQQAYLAQKLDTVIRLDIRMTNHSFNDFNDGSQFYRNFDLVTEDGINVYPTLQYQPSGQPETAPLKLGTTGVVQSYFLLDGDVKNTNVQEINIEYYYVRDLVNQNSQDFSSIKFKLPVTH